MAQEYGRGLCSYIQSRRTWNTNSPRPCNSWRFSRPWESQVSVVTETRERAEPELSERETSRF